MTDEPVQASDAQQGVEASQTEVGALPQAVVARRARRWWLWLIPISAAVFAAALIATYVVKHGPVITIDMTHGHGIKAGDVLRCRGITVGQVEHVRLTKELDGVEVLVRLEPDEGGIARAGSRFWVVRPRVSFSGVEGLDTVAGPRYLAVEPGTGERQKRFTALAEPPILEAFDSDGLEIVLAAARRGSIQAGSPVLYRQIRVGAVLSVGLASDAGSVDVRAYIFPQYRNLVRGNSRFWNSSGVDVQFGLKGLRLGIESLHTLIDGGVALATPDKAGTAVRNGHRFTLYDRPEDEWLTWRPQLAVGHDLIHTDSPLPAMVRIAVTRTTGRIFKSRTTTRGWMLPMGKGYVGPAGLLRAEETAELEVAGQKFDLTAVEAEAMGSLTRLALKLEDSGVGAGSYKTRALSAAEDCVIWTEASASPIPIAAARLSEGEEGRWRIDGSLALDEDLNGAAVVSRGDGALVGMVLVEEGSGTIVPVPE